MVGYVVDCRYVLGNLNIIGRYIFEVHQRVENIFVGGDLKL